MLLLNVDFVFNGQWFHYGRFQSVQWSRFSYHTFLHYIFLDHIHVRQKKGTFTSSSFPVSSSLLHSSSDWSSDVISNNPFTLVTPEVYPSISHMFSFGVSIHILSSFWEILSFTWIQQRKWFALLKHVLIASNNFFSPSVPYALKLTSTGFNRNRTLANEKYGSQVLLEWIEDGPSKTGWTLELTLYNSGWR